MMRKHSWESCIFDFKEPKKCEKLHQKLKKQIIRNFKNS